MPFPTTTQPRVIVFHPGTQHSHYLAVGVQRAGMLETYISRIYFNENRWPFSLIKFLPSGYQQRVRSTLSSRRHPKLDTARVKTIQSYAEWFYVILSRFKIGSAAFRDQWMLSSARRFSRQVGPYAVDHDADILIGTDDASCEAFRVAKSHGVICVLDLAVAHRAISKKIYDEEAKLHPLLASTMRYVAPAESVIQYSLEEVGLADYFLVGSSFPKQSLVDLGVEPERIFIIPYGVDIDLFSPVDKASSDSQQLRVLFAGQANQRKGIGYLLEAIHQLRPNYAISLTICGEIPLVVQGIGRYKGDYIALGRVNYTDMPDIFRQADVVVLPSLIEGFPRVNIEAMASGLPVIGTEHTGLQDLITDGVEGFVIPIRDVEAIKDRLIFLLENPAKRSDMGKAARNKAEMCSWDQYYRKVAQALDLIWEQHQQRVS